jgi:hypothetical protein
MKYSVEQRVFIYDTFVKHSSWRKCCRKFRRKYPDLTVPCKSTIYKIVKKVRKTGSVLDKKKHRKRHILTEEILDDIGARLEASPKISLRRLALECGLSKTTTHVAIKLLKQHSYESTLVQNSMSPDCGKSSGKF